MQIASLINDIKNAVVDVDVEEEVEHGTQKLVNIVISLPNMIEKQKNT